VCRAAKEPGRLTTFNLNFDGTLTQLAVFDLNPAVNGEPQDIKFCRPTLPSHTPRLAISFNDPSDPSQPGTVRLYQPVHQGNQQLHKLTEFSGKAPFLHHHNTFA
jgi:hypothetical protein